MNRVTFTIAHLKAMPGPKDCLDQLRQCAIECTDEHMVFDQDAPCYRAIKEKYAAYSSKRNNGARSIKYVRVRRKSKLWATTGRLAHGVAGYTKATLGIDAAPDELVAIRLATCEKCPENAPCIGNVRIRCCGKLLNVLRTRRRTCGCRIAKKTRIAGEKCPLGKW